MINPRECPLLPDDDLSVAFAVPAKSTVVVSLTKHLDDHLANHEGQDKSEILLRYVAGLESSVDGSMLLQAECAYLFFQTRECPIMYHALHGAWYIWSTRGWSQTDGCNCVMELFQTSLLKVVRTLRQMADAQNIFRRERMVCHTTA